MTGKNGHGELAVTGQLVRFLVVGGACYAANLALLWLAVEIARIHYVVATVGCAIAMIVLGHVLNRRHTFRSTQPYLPQLMRYAANGLAQIGFGTAAMAALVEWGHVHYVAANVAVTVLTTAASFVVQRAAVFR